MPQIQMKKLLKIALSGIIVDIYDNVQKLIVSKRIHEKDKAFHAATLMWKCIVCDSMDTMVSGNESFYKCRSCGYNSRERYNEDATQTLSLIQDVNNVLTAVQKAHNDINSHTMGSDRSVSGPISPSEIEHDLTEAWNLIRYPFQDPSPLVSALNAIGHMDLSKVLLEALEFNPGLVAMDKQCLHELNYATEFLVEVKQALATAVSFK